MNTFEKIALTNIEENALIGGGVGAALTIPSYSKPKPEHIKELKDLNKYRNLSGAASLKKKITAADMKFAKNLLKKYEVQSELKRAILPAKALKPEIQAAIRAQKLERMVSTQNLPLSIKGLRTAGKGLQTAIMAAGLAALMNKQASTSEIEIDKYAGIWSGIAGGVIKGFKNYGHNIVKDYRGLKSGFNLVEKADALKATKNLSKVKRLDAYKMGERGQKQLLNSAAGLGKRVGVPGLLAYTTLT